MKYYQIPRQLSTKIESMEIKCRPPGKTKSNNMDKTVDIIV